MRRNVFYNYPRVNVFLHHTNHYAITVKTNNLKLNSGDEMSHDPITTNIYHTSGGKVALGHPYRLTDCSQSSQIFSGAKESVHFRGQM
jgi:hypothetical protein